MTLSTRGNQTCKEEKTANLQRPTAGNLYNEKEILVNWVDNKTSIWWGLRSGNDKYLLSIYFSLQSFLSHLIILQSVFIPYPSLVDFCLHPFSLSSILFALALYLLWQVIPTILTMALFIYFLSQDCRKQT